MTKKVISIISMIIVIILYVSLFVNAAEYNSNYNIWADRDDAPTKTIVIIVVMAVIVGIIVAVSIPARKEIRKITKGKKSSQKDIKKNSLSFIKTAAVTILILSIISEENVGEFLVRNMNLDFLEAMFGAGLYQIFKEHFLWINIVMLIDHIITYFDSKQQVVTGVEASADDNGSESEKKELTEYEKEEINRISRKAALTILAILFSIVIVIFIIIAIKAGSQPSIDVEKLMEQNRF